MNNYSKELMHHGVQGMRWGIRRYQPYDIGYKPKQKGKFIMEINEDYKSSSHSTKTKDEMRNLKREIEEKNRK